MFINYLDYAASLLLETLGAAHADVLIRGSGHLDPAVAMSTAALWLAPGLATQPVPVRNGSRAVSKSRKGHNWTSHG